MVLIKHISSCVLRRLFFKNKSKKDALKAGSKIQHKRNKKRMFNILPTITFQPKMEVTNILL
jgi:hypothetical protein